MSDPLTSNPSYARLKELVRGRAATPTETWADSEIARLRSYLWAIRRRAERDDVSATDAIGVLAREALSCTADEKSYPTPVNLVGDADETKD